MTQFLLGVPGRDPGPTPGRAKLTADPFLAASLDEKPGPGIAKLDADPFAARYLPPNGGAGTARLAEEPLFAPNLERMFASEA